MLRKLLCVFAALAVAVSALAQASLGTIANVQGLVTVSDGTTIGNAVPGSPITDGMQFVTSSTGSLTLQTANGCAVTLKPNQTVTVQKNMTCDDLRLAIRAVDNDAAGGVFANAFGGGNNGLLIGAGLILVGGFIYDANRNVSHQ